MGLMPDELLTVWERAGAEPVLSRPTALLAAAGTADAAGLPLGARDAALLRWYAAMFGDRLEALATCPSCATIVELSVSCTQLLSDGGGVPVRPAEIGGYTVDWRLPTASDLVAIGASRDADEAAGMLLTRCVRAADRGGSPVPAVNLPVPVREAIGAAMAEADPLAEIVLAIDCPQCACGWSGRIDPAVFVWRHLQIAALRLLREVHTLASAYGWPESQILALSPARRAAYLGLVRGG